MTDILDLAKQTKELAEKATPGSALEKLEVFTAAAPQLADAVIEVVAVLRNSIHWPCECSPFEECRVCKLRGTLLFTLGLESKK